MTPTAVWVVEHSTAHLLAEGTPFTERQVSWCGLTLSQDSRPANYEARCKRCLARLRSFSEDALAELPEVVTETVVVTLTRPREQSESVVDYLARHLRKKTSWKAVNVRSQAVEPHRNGKGKD